MRAQTLRSLLDKSARDPDLRDAQQRAMNMPPISTILRRQRPDASGPGANLCGLEACTILKHAFPEIAA